MKFKPGMKVRRPNGETFSNGASVVTIKSVDSNLILLKETLTSCDFDYVEEVPASSSTDAMKVQVGGDHYKKRRIQPIEYILANKLGFCEGNIVKYVTRWQDKGGVQDLDKIIHYAQFLKEEELKRLAHVSQEIAP